jgi:hypothetical protein
MQEEYEMIWKKRMHKRFRENFDKITSGSLVNPNIKQERNAPILSTPDSYDLIPV